LEGVAAAGSGAGAAAGAGSGVDSFGVEVSGFGAQDENVRRMSARKGNVIRLIATSWASITNARILWFALAMTSLNQKD